MLLTEGAAVDRANDDEVTPLRIAADQGHTEVVRSLLEYSDEAAVNHASKNGRSPLVCASAKVRCACTCERGEGRGDYNGERASV